MARWIPALYQEEGQRNGYNKDYLRALTQYARNLASNNLPVVFTLGHLSKLTDTPEAYLMAVVTRRVDCYRRFRITKRSGGTRLIEVPGDNLLKTQRWIASEILNKITPHHASMAYGKQSSTFKNAQRHCGSRWLVKIDIADFFGSISEFSVFELFLSLGYTRLLAFQFARICTAPSLRRLKRSHLPQGAATSPCLSNLIVHPMDIQLDKLAIKHGCEYTRYADDIIFSSAEFSRAKASDLIREVDFLISKFGFKKNHKKTRVCPPGARKIVTGLVVNGPCPTLPKEFRDKIRMHLHYAKHDIAAHCMRRRFRSIPGFKNYLRGLIDYAVSIEPKFGARCLEKFCDLKWPTI